MLKPCPTSHKAAFKYWRFPYGFVCLPFVLDDVPVFEQPSLFTQKVVIVKSALRVWFRGTYHAVMRPGEPVIPAITAQSPALIINISESAASP